MSAKLVTVFNQKGGCAKTMTTMQLAGFLGRRGLRVQVIDMDPQNTSALWYAASDRDKSVFPADVLSLSALREGFISKLTPLVNTCDVIIVDCPPALGSNVPWVSLCASDLAIVPMIPVLDNVWACRQAAELVAAAKEQNSALEARFLFARVGRGKIYSKTAENFKENPPLPLFKTEIAARNAYPESQAYGSSVAYFGKSPAQEEMDSFTEEVAELLGLKLKDLN